jgi:hypothetical protein
LDEQEEQVENLKGQRNGFTIARQQALPAINPKGAKFIRLCLIELVLRAHGSATFKEGIGLRQMINWLTNRLIKVSIRSVRQASACRAANSNTGRSPEAMAG